MYPKEIERLNPNRSLDRKRLVSVERESSLGILPTSASVLLSVLPRRSPLRLQQDGKQSTRQKQAIYPKSNDRFGIKSNLSLRRMEMAWDRLLCAMDKASGVVL